MSNIKIFTDDIEDEALCLINSVASSPTMEGAKIRIMPDVHAGKGITIGFTCPVGKYVNPEHIGVDIGCGIETKFFSKVMEKKDIAKFERLIKKSILFGRTIHQKPQFQLEDLIRFVRSELNVAIATSNGLVNDIPFDSEEDVRNWCSGIKLDFNAFLNSIATIGGGNHFIELDQNEELGKIGVTIHTGSRIVGQKVCAKWNKIAKAPQINEQFKTEFQKIKETVEDKSQLEKLSKDLRKRLSSQFIEGYLSGMNLKGYLTDMVICQAYASFNRKIILQKIAEIYKGFVGDCEVENIVSSIHNYIDFRDMIIRKGAIRSYKGEQMVVPFNMRDGIAICEGKSNEDWNYSCSHGSGRKMSRTEAKANLSMQVFKDDMKGIYSTSVCSNTIDESPQAYKDTQDIIRNIAPTCKILYFMKPVMNIKDISGQ